MVAAVVADSRLRTVTNTFMVSLAISDVLIATVNMPVQLWYFLATTPRPVSSWWFTSCATTTLPSSSSHFQTVLHHGPAVLPPPNSSPLPCPRLFPPRTSHATITSTSSSTSSRPFSTKVQLYNYHTSLVLYHVPDRLPSRTSRATITSTSSCSCYHHIYVFLQSVPDRPQARSGCASITSSFVSTQFQTVPHHGPALLSPHYSRGQSVPAWSSCTTTISSIPSYGTAQQCCHRITLVYCHFPYYHPARSSHYPGPPPRSRLSFITVQLWYYVSNEWTLGQLMCKLSRYVQGVVIVNCILTLTGIAVDRYAGH